MVFCIHTQKASCLGNGRFCKCNNRNAILITIHRLMVIMGSLTLVTSVIYWSDLHHGYESIQTNHQTLRFIFPNSPVDAWFLRPEERVVAVSRLRANQAGVENKHFKYDQFVEALQDPKTWLFAAFVGLA
jgi:MFS transporter, ACS family, allantoate permease